MRLRLSSVLLVLFAVSSYAVASDDLLIPPDDDGCQTFLPFKWMDLAPGETWEATADMMACSDEEAGGYLFYGYLANHTHSPHLTLKDGIVLSVVDEMTGEELFFTGKKSAPQMIHGDAVSPCWFTLRAVNTSKKTVQVRFTWTLLGY